MLIDPCEILIIFLMPSLGFSSAPRQILVNRFVSPRSVDIQDIFEQQIYISALYRYPFTVGNRLIYILSIGIPILLISFAVRSLVIPCHFCKEVCRKFLFNFTYDAVVLRHSLSVFTVDRPLQHQDFCLCKSSNQSSIPVNPSCCLPSSCSAASACHSPPCSE